MLTSLIVFIIWIAGAGIYLTVSFLTVPDFVPSHTIKFNWYKAALWPLAIVGLTLTMLWKFVSSLNWNVKTTHLEQNEEEPMISFRKQ